MSNIVLAIMIIVIVSAIALGVAAELYAEFHE